MERSYHHGDLRASLVEAALDELRERGRDAFSLRRTAARAGVSHAAPAHHFGNADGLLAAVRAEGFARLVNAMSEYRDGEEEPFERMIATGMGYVGLAVREPVLFDLMFGPGTTYGRDQSAAEPAAFDILLAAVDDVRGDRERDAAFWIAVSVAWSVVHGYAQLAAAGRMAYLDELGPDRDATLRDILRTALTGILPAERDGG